MELFWILAIASTIGYSFNDIGFTFFVRKMDPLSAGVYRNLSLGISFLPILFFVPIEEYTKLSASTLSSIFLSAIIVIIPVFGSSLLLRAMPVGTFIGIINIIRVIFTALIAFIFFNEGLSMNQTLWILVAIMGALILGMKTPNQQKHLECFSWKKKIILLLAIGILLSIAFPILAKASREAHPLVVAHIWEFSIGVVGLFLLLIRKKTQNKGIAKISGKEFLKLTLYCSPTVIGTGAYALAVTSGSISLASAIGTLTIVLSTTWAFLFFKEKLNRYQIISIFIVVLGIAGLYLSQTTVNSPDSHQPFPTDLQG